MRQIATRSRNTGIVFLVLVCLVFAPAVAANDHFFRSADDQGETSSGCPLPSDLEDVGTIANDGSDSSRACLCPFCTMTIGNMAPASTLPLSLTGDIFQRSFVPFLVHILSEIFHPPRV
jgi:hypothetical protein